MNNYRTGIGAEAEDHVEALVAAEKRIGEAASQAGCEWVWAPYSKPSTEGPFMWNDIVVFDLMTGAKQIMQAKEFTDFVDWTVKQGEEGS